MGPGLFERRKPPLMMMGPDMDLLKETDANAIWTWMDNYCREHPLDPLYIAADTLGSELVRRAPMPVAKSK
jgi:hypothetical protein